MIIKSLSTYTATIWVGMLDREKHELVNSGILHAAVNEWCSRVKQGVTITETWFAYVDGGEPGYAIGFIDYPRFPLGRDEIRRRALELAEIVKRVCRQKKVSVVFPEDTVMLIDDDELAAVPEHRKP